MEAQQERVEHGVVPAGAGDLVQFAELVLGERPALARRPHRLLDGGGRVVGEVLVLDRAAEERAQGRDTVLLGAGPALAVAASHGVGAR
ncbi:hypothetical protein [Modestobacter sp. Leaf380]|uniref:hypothetical protein n=1 Tax=Modestobacter sp. Leaf380 TaxID=1736356 RepID=UPI00138F524B|nr:hypothetical protein [Modestobacter sp. Leaf380]